MAQAGLAFFNGRLNYGIAAKAGNNLRIATSNGIGVKIQMGIKIVSVLVPISGGFHFGRQAVIGDSVVNVSNALETVEI
ncbi:MAG TPA: hypothetical protein VJB68_09690 [Methylophilaceae bacterium]|nr:hypothetical protein [Methylophilaceae bacterium]